MKNYKKGDWVMAMGDQQLLAPNSLNKIDGVKPWNIYNDDNAWFPSYFREIVIRTKTEKLLAKALYG